MKTNISSSLAAALAALALPVPAHAGRSSTNYEISSESFSPGGGIGSSANYEIRSSLEPIGGSGSSENYSVESGWTGFDYQVIGLTLEVTPTVIEEGGIAEVMATATLSDESLLALRGEDVEWIVTFDRHVNHENPIPSLSLLETPSLLYAPRVLHDTSGVLEGRYQAFVAQRELTVLNIADDDFGSYAADGIDDDWQVDHFGMPPNEEAGPDANPDGDPADNLSEFLGGFDPDDPAEYLRLQIVRVSKGEVLLEINKVIPGRTYTVQAGTDLTEFPETVSTFTVPAEETDRPEVDSNASTPRKFYRLKVEKERAR